MSVADFLSSRKKLRKTFGGAWHPPLPPSLVRPRVNICVSRYHDPEIIYRHENVDVSTPGEGHSYEISVGVCRSVL